MRTLLVTNDYPPKPGGIQQYLANIVERHDGPVRVLAPSDKRAVSDPDVVRHPRQRFMFPTPTIRRWITAHIDEFQPDFLVFGAPHPLAALGPRLLKESGVRYAVMTHGAEFLVPSRVPVLRAAVVAPIRQADVVFAVSDFTRSVVEAASQRPVIRLGAGVDLDRFHPASDPPRPPVVGCVSRFVPRKGHSRVIAAADQLFRAGHELSVLIVGRGRLEDDLRSQADQASVSVRFEVDVAWSELPELYRQMSVFAMPARTRWAGLEVEGLGIVYLEAAASGLPVITGRSGGAPETVVPGVTGATAETVDELVQAIAHFLDDESLQRARVAARALAEREYSWESVMERWNEGLAGGKA